MEIVSGNDYLKEVKRLIIEYSKALNRDLSFQNFDKELNSLNEKYTGENGSILVAVTDESNVVGRVASHKLTNIKCEMKRLFVMPEYRKLHIG